MTIEQKKQKIVIIESTNSFGEKIVEDLKKDGYSNISLYKDGYTGLKGIYDNLPHLILLDISLSDMDGYLVLEKKQNEALLSKIPVFLMSLKGVAINMRNIPQNSVTEVLISLDTKSLDIVDKVNDFFGYKRESQESEKTQSVKKIKLLWIEDDRLIGNILSKKIISSGFDLIHAKDGESALKILQNVKPDIIIIDLILPGLNGFDILDKLRLDPELKKTPKMILSNLSKISDIDRAKALGADKYLVKASTSLDQVIEEIRSMCKNIAKTA